MPAPSRSPAIVWAEDDLQDQALIRAALEDVGDPGLAFAEDGVQLLEMVARHLPRLVVLDLKMPRMGGLEALRRLRSEPATRHVPVVVFSSGSLPDEIDKIRQLGVVDVVQKPIAFSSFAVAVQGIVRARVTADVAEDRRRPA